MGHRWPVGPKRYAANLYVTVWTLDCSFVLSDHSSPDTHSHHVKKNSLRWYVTWPLNSCQGTPLTTQVRSHAPAQYIVVWTFNSCQKKGRRWPLEVQAHASACKNQVLRFSIKICFQFHLWLLWRFFDCPTTQSRFYVRAKTGAWERVVTSCFLWGRFRKVNKWESEHMGKMNKWENEQMGKVGVILLHILSHVLPYARITYSLPWYSILASYRPSFMFLLHILSYSYHIFPPHIFLPHTLSCS